MNENRKTQVIAEEITKFLEEHRPQIIKRAMKRLKAEQKEAARNAKKAE